MLAEITREIRKIDHKSETVRIRLRGLEAFMRWVVKLTASSLRHKGHPRNEIASYKSKRIQKPVRHCHGWNI